MAGGGSNIFFPVKRRNDFSDESVGADTDWNTWIGEGVSHAAKVDVGQGRRPPRCCRVREPNANFRMPTCTSFFIAGILTRSRSITAYQWREAERSVAKDAKGINQFGPRLK